MVLDPKEWRAKARALAQAANVLEPSLNTFWNGVRQGVWEDEQVSIYFMLCSFALENLIKASLIELKSPDGSQPQEVQSLPKYLQTHDLFKLVQKCDRAPLANEYASILCRLSRSATWYSRYPIPVRETDIDPFMRTQGDQIVSRSGYSGNDRREIAYLFAEFGLRAW